MDIKIYGLNLFADVVNWFSSPYALILFFIITAAAGYLFYKLNFTEHENSTRASNHYGFNILLIGVYGILLFWVSKYVLKMDLIMSVIFTGIFYSVSIFALTMILIFMRRSKLKKFVINSAKWINDNPMAWKYDNKIDKIRLKCIEGDHYYTNMLLKDIDLPKPSDKDIYDENKNFVKTIYPKDNEWKGKGKRPIDVSKYEALNIWENKNMALDE